MFTYCLGDATLKLEVQDIYPVLIVETPHPENKQIIIRLDEVSTERLSSAFHSLTLAANEKRCAELDRLGIKGIR